MAAKKDDDNGKEESNHCGVAAVFSADSVVKYCGSEEKKGKLD
jgi:hypothetical protein